MRLPRTTGLASGFAIVILGLWGALIPFVGPYFHYAFGNYDTWHFTTNRLWLDIVPGALAVIGGLLLLRSATRKGGLIGGWMAVVAGGWFAIGPTVSLLWHGAGSPIGRPLTTPNRCSRRSSVGCTPVTASSMDCSKTLMSCRAQRSLMSLM